MLHTFSIFLSLIWKRKGYLFLYVPLFLIALGLIQLQPFFFKLIIDSAEAMNIAGVQQWIWLYIITLAVGHGIENMDHLILGFYLGRMQDDLMVMVMKSLRHMDHYFHTSKSSGSLISIVKRGDGAFYGFGWNIMNRIISVLIQTLISLVTFWFLAPSAFYILLGAIAVLCVLMRPIIIYNLAARRKLSKIEDTLSGTIVDNLIAFENVKIFDKEQYEAEKIENNVEGRRKAGEHYLVTFQYLNYCFVGVMIIAIATIMFFSFRDLQSSVITTGTFILILTFLSRNFYALWDVVYGMRDTVKSYSDIEIYARLIDLKPVVTESASAVAPSDIQGHISIKDVSFAYAEKRQKVLKDVTLSVKNGETIAFVGKSGGGKTTLAKLIMRFYDTTDGQILIDGYDLKHLSFSSLRQTIGMVPQDPVLFNNTIGYNIGYAGTGISQKDIEDAARRACLDEFIEGLPDKYDTLVGERGIKLSGGQRQRLAIARAFVHNPQIIIFDEATSQLDSENEKLIAKAMDELRANKTMIIIAHRLSTIMHADKIAVFDNGIISEVGTHAELINTESGIYQRLWNMQTNGLIA